MERACCSGVAAPSICPSDAMSVDPLKSRPVFQHSENLNGALRSAIYETAELILDLFGLFAEGSSPYWRHRKIASPDQTVPSNHLLTIRQLGC